MISVQYHAGAAIDYLGDQFLLRCMIAKFHNIAYANVVHLENAWPLEARLARVKDPRLVFGSDVCSVSPIALPTRRIFMRSKSGVLRLSFKQFAAGSASVDVSWTAARAAACHARKT
jgi:hypothetical protein